MRRPLALVLIALLTACASQEARTPEASQTRSAAVTAAKVASRPPTRKDVIDVVLAHTATPLTVSPTCRNAGTEPDDVTLGRYLAGFMAEMDDPSTKNWIETTVTPGTSSGGDAVWTCRMTLRHRDGDDVWGWGVSFVVRQSDGTVVPESFTCTGAG